MISSKILLNHALIEHKKYAQEPIYKILPKIPVFKFYSTLYNRWVLIHHSRASDIFSSENELEDRYFICYWNFDRWIYLNLNNVFSEYYPNSNQERRLLEWIEIIKPDLSKTFRKCIDREQINLEYFS